MKLGIVEGVLSFYTHRIFSLIKPFKMLGSYMSWMRTSRIDIDWRNTQNSRAAQTAI